MIRLHTIPPTEQVYRSYVPFRYDGFSVEKYFADRFSYQDEQEWSRQIVAGKIKVNGKAAFIGQKLHVNDLTITQAGLRTEPPVDRMLSVVHQDENIRVFNKKAPIPVHPCGRYFKNSMTELLKEVYPDEIPRPVQRLDVTTTGIIVFARTQKTAAFLMREFKENRIKKEYLALVEGLPKFKQFTIDEPIGRQEGSKRAVGKDVLSPKAARTDVEWMTSIKGRSLLKVTPHSGRTNQIRVHLTSVGLPIYNDYIYGQGKTSSSEFGLHHRRMEFQCFDSKIILVANSPAHFQPYINKISEL